MATDGINPAIAIRSSVGVELWKSEGLKIPYIPDQNFIKDESKFCRAIEFSPDGRFLAWGNGAKVQICRTTDFQVITSLPRPKSFYIKFSSKGTYLMTWEIFATNKDNPEGSPNMYIYKTETGEEMFSVIQKKQIDWQPGWSNDESILAIMLGGEVLFYEVNTPNGFKTSTKKLGGGRNGSISVSPNNGQPFLAFYVPGVKGAPSMCKIYQYPVLNVNQAVSSKSFFQADKVDMMWNKRGTGLLLLTSTDVDQSGASYYGKQALHFMSTKGESFAVQLSKEGPIHAVSWSPRSNEFCVIYGYMPSKATLFNLKCDSVFEFGENPRNSIYYNDFGNLVLLAGFGNLRGNVECWDVSGKERKLISSLQASDSTLLEWNPNGETFLTATTAPRLRQSNGFKVWHYSGALLHETMWPTGQELLEVTWQKYHQGFFKEKPISEEKIEGIKSTQPQASTQVYRPPNVRGTPSNFNLYEENEKPRILPGTTSQNIPKSQYGRNSNSRQNNRRGRKPQTDNRQNKKEMTSGTNDSADLNTNNTTTSNIITAATNTSPSIIGHPNENQKPTDNIRPHPRESKQRHHGRISTGDPEKDKKVKTIQKKLYDINKLKAKKEKGELLEVNQLAKIDAEASLVSELSALVVKN